MEAKQRLHSLDFLRALMMLLGIVIHSGQIYMTMKLGFEYYKDPVRSSALDAVVIFINTFRMPVFFFLSGFFTAMLYQRSSLKVMLENRYRRILLPFVLFLPPLAIVLGLQWIGASQLIATGEWGLDISFLSAPELLWNNTHHLWFLYYLSIVILLAAIFIGLDQIVPQNFILKTKPLVELLCYRGVWSLVALGMLFGFLAMESYTGRLGGGVRWSIYWPSIVFFGGIFAFGWSIWYRKQELSRFAAKCWPYLAIAIASLAVGLYCFFAQGEYGSTSYEILHPVLAVSNALSVMFFVAGLTGLFYRYFNNYSPTYRYLVDSAYWVFLIHPPIIVGIALLMFSITLPAEVKFLITTSCAGFLCLSSYHFFVRNRLMGKFLGGK